jgi:hypothetical protein
MGRWLRVQRDMVQSKCHPLVELAPCLAATSQQLFSCMRDT